ncbi:MAG: SDR family NAD(P)-dependent oxidoreductase [Defluviitaleaceae bacterium]|nr:SDR family NAD(P)-dependent oxidoreductase [Defluviitaleaceae bacterium]
MKLCGKKYLITGASSGLGLAIVKQLSHIKGTKITAVARNIKPLEKMQEVFSLSLDVAKPENIEQMINSAMNHMGGIDCIIACAGFGYYERFENQDYGHIERIFQTNVLSPLYTLEYFLAKTSSKIAFVSISSMLGKFGLPGMALYSATKYALDGFQNSYLHEKPKRLHYMTVYPIGLKTSFWERIATDIPLPRPLQTANTAAIAILMGLRQNKQTVYTSPPSKLALLANNLLPIFVPAYQYINKLRFNRWEERRKYAEMLGAGVGCSPCVADVSADSLGENDFC